MQPTRIVVIPPTHEQSVFSFHVEQGLTKPFLRHLDSQGLTPWRSPTVEEKTGPDGRPVTQIDVDTDLSEAKLEQMVEEFLHRR